MKYDLPGEEGEVLPNLLGLTRAEEVAEAEFEGFLRAEILLSQSLTRQTRFTLKYIFEIHRLALGHLYSFAGKPRQVNLSKGGFAFPSAQFLSQSLEEFQRSILDRLPDSYPEIGALIRDIAIVHAELLFIHPFREGNGRTARVLAGLMARKQGFEGLNLEALANANFAEYVRAVQRAAGQDYAPMIEFIGSVFPVPPPPSGESPSPAPPKS